MAKGRAEAKSARRGGSHGGPATPKPKGWAKWRKPKVFLPLAVVALMLAGLVIQLEGNDPAPEQNTIIGKVAASEPTLAAKEKAPEPSPMSITTSSSTEKQGAGRKQPPVPAPAPAQPGVLAPSPVAATPAQQATVNSITVIDSPGAATGAFVNVNTIEVGPEQ